MKKRMRIVSLVSAMLLTFSLVSCGKEPANTGDESFSSEELTSQEDQPDDSLDQTGEFVDPVGVTGAGESPSSGLFFKSFDEIRALADVAEQGDDAVKAYTAEKDKEGDLAKITTAKQVSALLAEIGDLRFPLPDKAHWKLVTLERRVPGIPKPYVQADFQSDAGEKLSVYLQYGSSRATTGWEAFSSTWRDMSIYAEPEPLFTHTFPGGEEFICYAHFNQMYVLLTENSTVSMHFTLPGIPEVPNTVKDEKDNAVIDTWSERIQSILDNAEITTINELIGK